MSDEIIDRYHADMQVGRHVRGDDHVDRASVVMSDLARDCQQVTTEMVWGSVWARGILDHRTRSLVTSAILAAAGTGRDGSARTVQPQLGRPPRRDRRGPPATRRLRGYGGGPQAMGRPKDILGEVS